MPELIFVVGRMEGSQHKPLLVVSTSQLVLSRFRDTLVEKVAGLSIGGAHKLVLIVAFHSFPNRHFPYLAGPHGLKGPKGRTEAWTST